MRHLKTFALVATLIVAPRHAFAQDSVTGPDPFRSGQWAAELSLENLGGGLGALRFTSPNTAWRLSGWLSSSVRIQDGDNVNAVNVRLMAGRRWYGATRGRIRTFSGFGLSAAEERQWQGDSWTFNQLDLGIYGEVGGQIFIARDLSIGAQWPVTLNYSRIREPYYPDNPYTDLRVRAGYVQLIGALYF